MAGTKRTYGADSGTRPIVTAADDVTGGHRPEVVCVDRSGVVISGGGGTSGGTVSVLNSSTATLLANAPFTGAGEDISSYAAVIVNVFADQAGTLSPQFSSDGTHWDMVGSHPVVASTGAVFLFRPSAGFFRVVYTNGGTNQGAFRLQTIYHTNDVDMATAQALGAGLANPTTIQVGADLMVQTGGGTTWAPAKADSSNRLVAASDDGSLATLGTTTDAGIITNIAGTVIGFLRGQIIQWAALLTRLPAALISGRLDVNLGAAPALVTVQGDAAAGTTLAGNPVLVGVSDGTNAQNALCDNQKNIFVNVRGTNSSASTSVIGQGDGQTLSNGFVVYPLNSFYSGSNWDRARNNVDVTLLASAARTTTQPGSNITAYNCQAIAVTLDVTAIVSTCSLTVTIGYVDPASGKVVNLLTSAVIAAVSTTMFLVDPRVVAAANLVAMKPIGRVFVITVTVGNANSQTYSVGYTLIPC